MLKDLKQKKNGKQDVKKDIKKEKQPKGELKKQQEEEEQDTNQALVDINYDQKEKNNTKNQKKTQSSKLEEKQIDTSNIVIEEKKEVKPTSWVIEEKDIKKNFGNKFDMQKQDTDFTSLTDHKLNEQLEEKAKQEEKLVKVIETNGIKYAPLVTSAKVDVNDGLVFKKVDVNPVIGIVTNVNINPPQFKNSKMEGFAPLEKSSQQLKEEELQKKMQNKEQELVLKGKGTGWLGAAKTNEVKLPTTQFKVSQWAYNGTQPITAPTKFAPLQSSQQDRRMERPEQQFKYSSKKEQEQRRKKKEEEEALKKVEPKQ